MSVNLFGYQLLFSACHQLIYLGTAHKVPSIFSVNLSGSYLEEGSFKDLVGVGSFSLADCIVGLETVSIWLQHLKVVSAAFLLVCFLRLVSVIFHEVFIFHQLIALQKLWNIKCSLLHLQSSFHSRDIQIFIFSSSPLFLHVSHCFRSWFKKGLKVYDVSTA